MADEETVIARREGRAGRLLLNRPQALNALDLPMIRACTNALKEWRDDPHVHVVVIEGAGEPQQLEHSRVHCGGGKAEQLGKAVLHEQQSDNDTQDAEYPRFPFGC